MASWHVCNVPAALGDVRNLQEGPLRAVGVGCSYSNPHSHVLAVAVFFIRPPRAWVHAFSVARALGAPRGPSSGAHAVWRAPECAVPIMSFGPCQGGMVQFCRVLLQEGSLTFSSVSARSPSLWSRPCGSLSGLAGLKLLIGTLLAPYSRRPCSKQQHCRGPDPIIRSPGQAGASRGVGCEPEPGAGLPGCR